MRQEQRERQHAEDRAPDHEFRSEPVGQRPAEEGAGRDRSQEDEQHHLGLLDRHVERPDQVEGVVAADARQIDHLREQHDDQHGDRADDDGARMRRPRRRRSVLAGRAMRRVPPADAGQEDDGDQREDGEGEHRMLPERHDDEGRQQRSGRLAEIAADLKQALRESVPSAGRGARDPRGLGMEDGAADPDHRDREQNQDDKSWRRPAGRARRA